MPILQIFRKDRRYWSESDVQEVQLFFMLHPFFSKFYEHDDFEKVVNFTFYSHLKEGEELRLELNKKSEIMILLSGEVTLYRKAMQGQLKKKKKLKQTQMLYGQYIKMGDYQQANKMIELRNDIIVKSKTNCPSELIYIPTLLYETHNYTVNNRKLSRVLQVLEKFFIEANKRDLKNLAESGCVFRQFKMNSFIYRAGSVPDQCFILVSGNVKVQSSGFSAKKMMDMSIISQNTLFGDKDLNQEARTHNSICCSAHCKILAIKKQPFNRFISKNKHINPAYAEKIKSIISEKSGRGSSLMKQYEDKHMLPRIMRFHSFARPEEQEKIQKDLLQNCHMLINLSPHKRSASSFRSPSSSQHEKDYSVNQFDKKFSLYKRLKSHRPFEMSAKLF